MVWDKIFNKKPVSEIKSESKDKTIDFRCVKVEKNVLFAVKYIPSFGWGSRIEYRRIKKESDKYETEESTKRVDIITWETKDGFTFETQIDFTWDDTKLFNKELYDEYKKAYDENQKEKRSDELKKFILEDKKWYTIDYSGYESC